MKVRTLIKDLFNFLGAMRQSGTTTLLKKVAAENDVWVLVPTKRDAEEFSGKGIAFSDLYKLCTIDPKPILIDNYTLIQLSELAYNEMESLSDSIRKRNKLIREIRDSIANFERVNGKLNHSDDLYIYP